MKNMIIHCDASLLDKHTFIIGYKAFQDKHCAYKKIYARSVNEAELAAIDFALSAFPEATIYSDSMYACQRSSALYIPRNGNLANIYLRSIKATL